MNPREKDRSLLRDLDELARVQPDAEATARAIERARAAVSAKMTAVTLAPSYPRRKSRMSLRSVGAIAAGLVAVAVLNHWWTPFRATSGLAFGEVQRQVEKTKTVQYMQTREVRVKGNPKPVETQTRKVMILGSHRMREEVTVFTAGTTAGVTAGTTAGDRVPDRYVHIQNMETGKTITLYPEKKGYTISQEILAIDPASGGVKRQAIKAAPEVDFYRRIREVPAEKAKKLADRTIAGKVAAGFQVVEKIERPAGTDTWTGTYWVDPETKLPVRIETSSRSTDPMWADGDTVKSEIMFDRALDESLFSTDPPAGYQDLTPKDAQPTGIGEAEPQSKTVEAK